MHSGGTLTLSEDLFWQTKEASRKTGHTPSCPDLCIMINRLINLLDLESSNLNSKSSPNATLLNVNHTMVSLGQTRAVSVHKKNASTDCRFGVNDDVRSRALLPLELRPHLFRHS